MGDIMIYNIFNIIALLLGVLLTVYIIVLKISYYIVYKKRLTIKKMNKSKINKRKISDSFDLFLIPMKSRVLKFTPMSIKNRIDKLTVNAGVKRKTGDIILIKTLLGLLFIFLSILLIPSQMSYTLKLLIIIGLPFIGFLLPDFYLKRKAKSRKEEFERTMINFVDYLTIAVEAGLGLDTAIFKVLSKIKGALAEEIANAMTDVKYGKTKKEAFKSLSEKVNVPEFTTFLTTLVNSEQLGVSLGQLLKAQSEGMREKRKYKIQEKAFKIPVKITVPLVLFILPGLFIVILGPAVIQIMDLF